MASSVANVARLVNNLGPETRPWVMLRGLPRTALPTDIRRLCAQANLSNVAKVEIDYSGYHPTGRAWVTTTAPEHTLSTVTALKRRMVGGMIIRAHPSTPNLPFGLSMRGRGKQGRAEAAERGILRGDGPSANLPSSSSGRTVVISGLPGMMTTDALKTWLKSFKFAGSTAEEKEIIKVELTPGTFSLMSKFVIRLASVSEAHRLVRKLHQTFYARETFEMHYPIRARVLH